MVVSTLRATRTDKIRSNFHTGQYAGSRVATSEKFRGSGKVTFGNDYDVIDVQSTMMRLLCYDQLTNIGGGTFFIVGGHGHFVPLLIGILTKYI